MGGNYVGVGSTGYYWEDVRNGQYYLGLNWVLYSGNIYDNNFGRAVNDSSAGLSRDTNLSALASEDNERLVQAAAGRLENKYGFASDRALVVASALNQWAVAGAERGYTTDRDMDASFRQVFGVDYSEAQSLMREAYVTQDTSALVNRSASALGLRPSQAEEFLKSMYSEILGN